MLRREKIVYSVFLIVTVVLASTIVFSYMDRQRSAELESYQTISRQADFVYDGVNDMMLRVGGAYSKMKSDVYDVSVGNISNETRIELFYRTIDDYFPDWAFQRMTGVADVQIRSLSYYLGEGDAAMHNVSDTVQYAIEQIWFVFGRDNPDYSYRLIGELYDIFGIDSGGENRTGLEGIAHSFDAISSQYNALSLPQVYPYFHPIQLSTMFDWAVGNATMMYQALLVWHENNPR